MSKVFKYGFIALILIVIILLLIPFLFKDEIFKRVKEEANKNLNGELFIEDLSLSLLRDFPNLTLNLSKVRYQGEAPFKGIELFNIDELNVELDIMSVLKGETIDVEEIALNSAKIHVKVLQDGTANYLILKEDSTVTEPETEETEPFSLKLQKFSIEGLILVYDDLESDIYTTINGGDFTLVGDFTNEEVAVKTLSNFKELTVIMDELTYLNKVVLTADVDAVYNQESGLITLAENSAQLNNLFLKFNGWVQDFDDKMAMDLNFQAPNSDFKELLSLVPLVFMQGYEDVRVAGKFSLKGNVNGDYFYEGDDLPGFDLAINIANGNFKYPDLPSSVTDINMKMSIAHPQGDADKTVINISQSRMKIAGSPFNASLLLKTPISDPDIDLKIATNLELKKLTEVVPVEGSSFNGHLWADAHIKGKLSQFENELYDQVVATGWLKANRVSIRTTSVKEEVKIDTAYMVISPQQFSLPILKMTLGKSDFTGSGNLTNMLGYALADDTLRGSFALNSTLINVTELMNMLPEEEEGSAAASAENTGAPAIPAKIDVTIAAAATQVLYDDLDLKNVSGSLIIRNSTAYLQNFVMDYLAGKVLMAGNYTTSATGKGLFDFDMELKNIDAKQSFAAFNTVQSFAPIANTAEGTFSTKMSFKGALTDALEPDLTTLNAKGNLYTLGMMLQPEIMTKVADILNDQKYKAIKLADTDLSFEIKDGRVKVAPIKLFMGDVKAEFSGTHGLDQTMDYLLKSEITVNTDKLPAEVKALNLTNGKIPVELKIGGTFKNPTVKPFFGEGIKLEDVVKKAVTKVVTEAKDSVINTVNNASEKILADAKKKSDAILAEAEKQANAIKAEAAKQADALKAETRKQAEKLKAEAKTDPLKEYAAKISIDRMNKETDKKIVALQQKATQQADAIMQKARAESDRILKEAEEKAKIQN